MTMCRNIGIVWVCVLSLFAVGCSGIDEITDNAQLRIVRELNGKYIYERGNLPEDFDASTLKGSYDIIGGAYRHIVNEEGRDDRDLAPVIREGDLISFYFDGRIYGGNFDSSPTFYTNIASRRAYIAGSNPDFDVDYKAWPVEALTIRLGDDPGILKSLQSALISCRAGTLVEGPDGEPVPVAGDQVRVYLTPDLAFGNKTVYNVPARSTLVFEITNIEIIE